MIQITPHMRIYAALEAIDFRKEIMLGGCCRRQLQRDPFSGSLFLFGMGGRAL